MHGGATIWYIIFNTTSLRHWKVKVPEYDVFDWCIIVPMKWFDATFLLASLIIMPNRKMKDFFTTGIVTGSVTPSRPTGTGSVPAGTRITVDVEIHVDGEEAPCDLDQIEVVQETA